MDSEEGGGATFRVILPADSRRRIDPSAVSTEPGSYNTCPIGKRMVVVSAGVIANVILAVVLFIWAFMAGVRSEMPVVGDSVATMPAATARAVNADALSPIST